MAPVEKFTFWDHRLGGQRWHIYSSSLRSEKDSETLDGSVWKWPKSFYRWKRQQLSGTKADVRKILTPEPWWGGGGLVSVGRFKEVRVLREVWTESSAAELKQSEGKKSQWLETTYSPSWEKHKRALLLWQCKPDLLQPRWKDRSLLSGPFGQGCNG